MTGIALAPPREPDRWAGGPLLWERLHRWALSSPGLEAAEWLGAFRCQIACGDCRRHWDALLAEVPRTAAEDLFEWTVRLHNAMNTRLGKPVMDLPSAHARWSSPPCGPGPSLSPPLGGRSAAAARPPEARPAAHAALNCRHAAAAGAHHARCALGLFGGTPHRAVCAQCVHRSPAGRPRVADPMRLDGPPPGQLTKGTDAP
jgi:hypothetical protein